MSTHIKTTLAALAASCLSVAAHSATPTLDDVDFYGSLRLGIDNIDAGTQDDGANGRDFLSRIGVKAQVELEPGLTAVGHIEYGIRENNLVDTTQNEAPTLRLAYAGLKGKYGEIYFGSQTLLWHKYVRSSYFSDGLDTVRQGSIRDDDLLQYYYKQGNWSVGAGLQFKGQDGDSIDQYQLGGEYSSGPIKLQAAWSKDNRGDNTGNLYGLRAWWKATDNLTLSAFTHKATDDYDLYAGSSTGTVRLRESSIEGNKNAINSCSGEDRTSTGVYASYRFGANQVHGRYAVDSCDVSGDVDSVKVEYIRHFSKAFRGWLAYEDLSNDSGRKPTTSTGEDFSQLQVGVRYDF